MMMMMMMMMTMMIMNVDDDETLRPGQPEPLCDILGTPLTVPVSRFI